MVGGPTNAINVTNDLLLIFNTNSENSRVVKDYYLAHRPMVAGANVLGINCITNEGVARSGFTNQILAPYFSWLAAHANKQPQYIILFPDIPSRVEESGLIFASVQCWLSVGSSPMQPFVTSINMGLTNPTNDCVAYINKLAVFGTNNQLVISASSMGYSNTTYVLDDVRAYEYRLSPAVSSATNGLLQNGVPLSAILYSGTNHPCLEFDTNRNCTSQLELPEYQLTNAVNVAGYISWGLHCSLHAGYAVDGKVRWNGQSGWWIIETIESYNGARDLSTGYFLQWFSPNAFGGTNYSNTPVGAVTHVAEPGLGGVNDSAKYFGAWAKGKNFAICAWRSTNTILFQAVGDPFVSK